MRIRIVPYQQLVDQDKNARGVFAKKWEVCVECDSLEEAEKLKETLAQPKQEPVAWMREDEDCTDCIVWEQTEEHTIPLYTASPQREWVGLTEEEKHDCYLRIDIWSRCYEMVEAKLREKNGG